MDLILVHLGIDCPSYMETCIKQIRRFTKNKIYLVADIMPGFCCDPVWNIERIKADTVKTENRERFNESTFLDNYGLKHFWRYACERLFVIEGVMKMIKAKTIFHIENDNLIYSDPEKFKLPENKTSMSIINDELLSAGIMQAEIETLEQINSYMVQLLSIGEAGLKKKYSGVMMHEMRLLGIISKEHSELFNILPIMPVDSMEGFLFDPASYGQYVGGVFQNPGTPYMSDTHYIGFELRRCNLTVQWEEKDGKKIPLIFDRRYNQKNKLANLHIHSKQLEKWQS